MSVPTVLPFDPWLDLADYIGQRRCSYRFEAIHGGTNAHLAELHPVYDATLSHDTTTTIVRQLNVVFPAQETATLNPLTDRVRVWMVLNGKQWPLGTYMFASPSTLIRSEGNRSNALMYDEGLIVDQELDVTFAPVPGTACDLALGQLLGPLPIVPVIEPSPYPTVGVWPIGNRRGQVVEDLSLDGDYYSPWFDHDRNMRFLRVFDPAERLPDMNLDVGNKVIRSSIAETDDVINAPNRFVVISNAAEAAATEIVGRYDIPDSAPHSIANRGFVIPHVERRQLSTIPQAQAVAAALGQRQLVYQTATLSTPPDPRHDGYNVLRWRGVNWLEIGWEMTLREGAPMRHTLRRGYTP